MQRKPVMKFDYEDKCMKQVKVEKENGEEVGLWEFDSAGANKALENLAKHIDFYKSDPNKDTKVVVEIKQVP